MNHAELMDEMDTLSLDLGSLVGAMGTASNYRMMAAKARHVAAVYEDLADRAERTELEESL